MEEKLIYSKILNKQACFFEENGEPLDPTLRYGRLIDDLYKNKKYISCINGKSEFVPLVEIYTKIFTDISGKMIINIMDVDKHQTVKQITIDMNNNNFNISDLKSLYTSYKTILESETNNEVITLLKKIKFESEDLIFTEYC